MDRPTAYAQQGTSAATSSIRSTWTLDMSTPSAESAPPAPTGRRKLADPKGKRVSRAERFGQIIDAERQDTRASLEALRLQVKAWRLLAIIAIADSERGKREARWLLMHSFPWIDADRLRTFIAEREPEAERLGIEAGVFDARHEKAR